MNRGLGIVSSSSIRVTANLFNDAAYDVGNASNALLNTFNDFMGNTFNSITHAANIFNQASNSPKHAENNFGDVLDDLPKNPSSAVAGIGTTSNAVHDIKSALHKVRGSV